MLNLQTNLNYPTPLTNEPNINSLHLTAEWNMKIIKFGETQNDKWYETIEGNRIKCTESTIEKLWAHWVISPHSVSQYQDNDGYYIFGYSEPQELVLSSLKTIEQW